MMFVEEETYKLKEFFQEYDCLCNLDNISYRTRNRQTADEEIVGLEKGLYSERA